jgi:hypothetical protein
MGVLTKSGSVARRKQAETSFYSGFSQQTLTQKYTLFLYRVPDCWSFLEQKTSIRRDLKLQLPC